MSLFQSFSVQSHQDVLMWVRIWYPCDPNCSFICCLLQAQSFQCYHQLCLVLQSTCLPMPNIWGVDPFKVCIHYRGSFSMFIIRKWYNSCADIVALWKGWGCNRELDPVHYGKGGAEIDILTLYTLERWGYNTHLDPVHVHWGWNRHIENNAIHLSATTWSREFKQKIPPQGVHVKWWPPLVWGVSKSQC